MIDEYTFEHLKEPETKSVASWIPANLEPFFYSKNIENRNSVLSIDQADHLATTSTTSCCLGRRSD